MNLWIKIPAVKRAVLNLEAEIRERDAFGEQLIEEVERLEKEKTELTTKLTKARDEYNWETGRLENNLKAAQDSADMWSKRWQDEHEKYIDLCDQLRGMMISLKDNAENVLAHTTIDT